MRHRLWPMVVVLALWGCGSASGQAPNSGIAGRVLTGPVCPVETLPPQPRCAPRPLAVALRVRRLRGAGGTRTVRSGVNGRFRVRLAPGDYLVQPLARSGSPFPRPPAPLRVLVRRGHFTPITIIYDTGIR
ncbi:MAG: hypothetical protein ACYC91_12455 [Solirubrobacteraceae bacterium]